MKAIVMFRWNPFAETDIQVPQTDWQAISNDLIKQYVMAMLLGDKSGVEKITELYSFSEWTLSAIEWRPFSVTFESLKEWIDWAFTVTLEWESKKEPTESE